MERLKFDSEGRLIAIDEKNIELPASQKPSLHLKTSDSLEFLKENPKKPLENIFEQGFWSFYIDNQPIPPLKFSNNKTQEDIVKEIVSTIKEGHKIIFLHGTCGTGKSAIALNVARVLGRASIVVPVKALQKQYEHDYLAKNHILSRKGEKMKIAMITGRENHDSIIEPGTSCADPLLPENIRLVEKNYQKICEYYKKNPLSLNEENPDLDDLRRISIAPANPHWSPIIPAAVELRALNDSRKIKYLGADGREYIFYHRRPGCSYYDQYLAYTAADVIIFNSAKYLSEMDLGRKPLTDIEIIDEADEFLDSLFEQEQINITRLIQALKVLSVTGEDARFYVDKIIEMLSAEEKSKSSFWLENDNIYHIKETKFREILEGFLKNSEIEAEIEIDELNYANKALEVARRFKSIFDSVYLSYSKDDENNLYVKLASINLSARIEDLIKKSKSIVFMSGTLHSENLIKNIFGIKDFKVIEAETLSMGSIEIVRTGKEMDCSYANFSSGKFTRKDYLLSLSASIDKAESPKLIHVNAFQDLPNEKEKEEYNLSNIPSSNELKENQKKDKIGEDILSFKKRSKSSLFTTKCSRGVDFPNGMCKSIIFTKYPNPNISDIFWKVLNKNHPKHYWEFYRDKAKREFIQRIYRALRSPKDHVYILSPDKRVLDAARELQLSK